MNTQMNRSTQHTARQTFSKSKPDNSKLVTNPRFQDRFCRFLVVFDLYHHCARRPYIVQCASADTCDGNWGEWNLSQVRWNWAQFSGPGLTFDLGDFIDNPNGRAAVDISGERIVFPESEYSIIHTKFVFDPVNKIEYPIQTVFRASVSTADHGVVEAEVTMDVQKTAPLSAFPGQVIYEQPSHFKGRIPTHAGEARNENGINFEGNGFKEFTRVLPTRQ
jgi:hypothetical protein